MKVIERSKFERHSCRRSSFDVSSRQPQPAPHDPNRPHTANQQALVTGRSSLLGAGPSRVNPPVWAPPLSITANG